MVVQYLSCHDKILQTWCLNNKSLFSHSSGGRSRSKVKVAGMVSGEAYSCLAGATCCCTLTGPVLCMHRAPGVSPSYCVDTGPDGLGPHPNGLIQLNHLPRGLISKPSHSRGQGFTRSLGEREFSPQHPGRLETSSGGRQGLTLLGPRDPNSHGGVYIS